MHSIVARFIGVDLDQAALDLFSCPYPVELVCADAHRFIDEIDYARSVDNTLNAYDIALKSDYRFFNYGDAMLII